MKIFAELGRAMIELMMMLTVAVAGERPPPAESFTCDDTGITTHFSCVGLGSERMAICERHGGARDTRSYRIELAVADGTAIQRRGLNSPDASFKFNHYSRFQTDYLEVSARDDGTEYRAYKHFVGEFGDDQTEYGMLITDIRTGAEERFECTKDVVDHLSGLPRVLECDRENVLGCGAYEQLEPGS